MARGSEGWEGVAGKEAYTVHTTNITSQWQYFVAHWPSSYVGNFFGFPSILKLVKQLRSTITHHQASGSWQYTCGHVMWVNQVMAWGDGSCCTCLCWWSETTSLNCGHQWVHCSSSRWCMSMDSHGRMILMGNRRTRRKTCPSATLTSANPTWTDSGMNMGLCCERPVTNCLSHSIAKGRDTFFAVQWLNQN
jgi:hypothetical protein